ncbi:DUF1036 domain-containing protein [Brevundimonas sp. FT23042]|uniref:DUF1036 domain-containing protein n=1 Tax=Brevundimonas sp. FT23042 TaxID=3393749 RepID=UPI003B587314
MKPIPLIAGLVLALTALPASVNAQARSDKNVSGSYGRPTVELKVCNRSGRSATVGVSYVPVGENTFMNRGWYDVANGACRDLVTTDNMNFYFYADATDGSGRSWQGSHTLCVEYPGPYTFYSTGSSYCAEHQDVRNFTAFRAEEPGTWTWTLDP